MQSLYILSGSQTRERATELSSEYRLCNSSHDTLVLSYRETTNLNINCVYSFYEWAHSLAIVFEAIVLAVSKINSPHFDEAV